jgi:hypothetical protein
LAIAVGTVREPDRQPREHVAGVMSHNHQIRSRP